jgi:hypothetical protein
MQEMDCSGVCDRSQKNEAFMIVDVTAQVLMASTVVDLQVKIIRTNR